MPLDKRYYVHTGYDGTLDTGDTAEADIVALVNGLAPDRHVVLHLHGGLVSPADAFDTAGRLLPLYLKAGVHPIFVVWESDVLRSVENVLRQVWQEGIFQTLVKHLLRHTVGLLRPAGGLRGRGTAAARPNDLQTAIEFQKLRNGEIPFGQVGPPKDLSPATDQELEDLKTDLMRDPVFAAEAPEVVRGLQAGAAGARAKGAGGPARPTLMSPEDFPEAAAVGPEGVRAKGGPNVAMLLYHAGKVLARVVSRFREGRDHGVYPTVVEEVLREFYFTNVGSALWGRMKRQTEYAFRRADGAPPPGALAFLDALARRFPPGGVRPSLSVVAHSAGGIYACHLLAALRDLHAKDPAFDLRLKDLLLLAPACDFRLFASVLGPAACFDQVRLFALRDELECGYWEVPVLYPRSLLYLVSGAFEKENGGDGAYDLPLLGMERYHVGTDVYKQPEVGQVRQFLAGDPKRQVWSVEAGGLGLDCDTRKHGDFCLDSQTRQPTRAMYSVLHVLEHGW